MSNWPTVPLIRIIKGYDSGKLREDIIAFKCKGGNSYRGDNFHIVRGYPRDSIDEWEEVTAVPTAALEEFKEAWKGFGMYDPDDSQRVTDAITSILACLPADKPTTLDQAAAMVEDMGGPMISAETLPADRLSLILDALASVQGATRKATPLAMFARICVDWANVEGKRSDPLEAARRKADALSISHDFITLAGLVADVIAAMDENFSPHHDLIDATAYALAWVARIIKEEE